MTDQKTRHKTPFYDPKTPEGRLQYLQHGMDKAVETERIRASDLMVQARRKRGRRTGTGRDKDGNLTGVCRDTSSETQRARIKIGERKGTSLALEHGWNLKRCTHEYDDGHVCRRVAVKEGDVCWFHGGKQIKEDILRRHGIVMPKKKSSVRLRRLQGLMIAEAVPAGLWQHPAFANAMAVLREPFTGKRGTIPPQQQTALLTRKKEAARAAYDLVIGYTELEINPSNSRGWLQALENAKKLGFS